jgi:transcriptional regulator with XRE-family HTH domain
MTPAEPTTRLGDLLRTARRESGLTLEELSGRAGVGIRTLGDLERNRISRPHRRTVDALLGSLPIDDERRAAIWAAARPAPVPVPASASVPADPPAARTVGREAETANLRRWFDHWHRGQRSPGPVIISGLPGVGKSTFSEAFCHTHVDEFPDGQLVLDLGGSGPSPLEPLGALGALLGHIGVPREQLPDSVDERGLLFRSRMQSLAMLVGLADAADEAQVRPLLPDNTPSLILITSRRTLAGLHAGKRIMLREPTPADAVAILAELAGPERVAAEPGPAAELARLCGYLPLALRVAATRLTTRPGATIADLVDRLTMPDERFARLTVGDLRVRDVFEAQYRRLAHDEQRTFRRLSVLRGTNLTAAAVATALRIDAEMAEGNLEGLVDAGLLTTAADGGTYQVNGLIRQFGREVLAAEESAASVQRLLNGAGLVTAQVSGGAGTRQADRPQWAA